MKLFTLRQSCCFFFLAILENSYLLLCARGFPFCWDSNSIALPLEQHPHLTRAFRWSTIASQLPGRTDNEIKNFWNTHLKKRLVRMGLDPAAHASGPTAASSAQSPTTRHMAQWESARLEAEARLSRESLLFISSQPEPLPSVPGKSDTDHFLRIWNSDVGDSFRRFRGRDLATSCNSPMSPASSSTAMAAATATASTITSDRCGSDEVETGVLVKSELSSSNEGEESEDDDSQDTSLNLLLDLPADEMGFFQGQISNFPFNSD